MPKIVPKLVVKRSSIVRAASWMSQKNLVMDTLDDRLQICVYPCHVEPLAFIHGYCDRLGFLQLLSDI